MKAAALIKQIRTTKGKLLVWVNSSEDGMYIAAEKQDIIRSLQRWEPEEETGFCLFQLDTGETAFGTQY